MTLTQSIGYNAYQVPALPYFSGREKTAAIYNLSGYGPPACRDRPAGGLLPERRPYRQLSCGSGNTGYFIYRPAPQMEKEHTHEYRRRHCIIYVSAPKLFSLSLSLQTKTGAYFKTAFPALRQSRQQHRRLTTAGIPLRR